MHFQPKPPPKWHLDLFHTRLESHRTHLYESGESHRTSSGELILPSPAMSPFLRAGVSGYAGGAISAAYARHARELTSADAEVERRGQDISIASCELPYLGLGKRRAEQGRP